MSGLTAPPILDWHFRRFTFREKAALTVEIVRSYIRARWSLSRRSLPETLSYLRTSVERSQSEAHAQRVAAHRLARAVVRVLGSLPMDSRCLTRSVVLTDLLAKRGIPSSLVIGVATDPDFAAHAWVELEGEPLLPVEDGKYAYARLVEL